MTPFQDPANDAIPSVELVCRELNWTTEQLVRAGLDWVSVYRRRWFNVFNPMNRRWLEQFCTIVNTPWVTPRAIIGRDYAIARSKRAGKRKPVLQQRDLDNQTPERSGAEDVQDGDKSSGSDVRDPWL